MTRLDSAASLATLRATVGAYFDAEASAGPPDPSPLSTPPKPTQAAVGQQGRQDGGNSGAWEQVRVDSEYHSLQGMWWRQAPGNSGPVAEAPWTEHEGE